MAWNCAIAKITDAGEIDFASLEEQFADGKVKLLAITHMSNVLGTYTPAERLAAFAHERGAKILLDGSQAVVHRRVDVQAIDADFYVFSGPQALRPLRHRRALRQGELLEAMPPFLAGGDMIASVSFARSTWAKPPHRFEAGTPAIIETIGLGAAIDYVQAIGFDAIAAHERVLTDHALAALSDIEGLKILGTRAGPRRGDFLYDAAMRMRMTSQPCWTARVSPCAPGIIARNR